MSKLTEVRYKTVDKNGTVTYVTIKDFSNVDDVLLLETLRVARDEVSNGKCK